MEAIESPKQKGLLEPILVFVGIIGLVAYGVITAISGDPLWFLGGVSMPDPQRIVIRVQGDETVLTANSPGYEILVRASKKALDSFVNSTPVSLGLSDETLIEYRERSTVLELYFDEPVDFHLPFADREPTALLIPVSGRHAGHNYVFRGGNGQWWVGPIQMSNSQPIFDALSALGYIDM